MESMLGFSETLPENDAASEKSHSLKLVPWLGWDEWDYVRNSLFSSSPHSIASALQRIAAWRSRGCLPVIVEVTASIIEIQQKDPFFRNDLNGRAVDSDEVLSMLYCMAIMRLVNCVIERTRKKTEISIAEAAEAIGIPRMLIDIRHEGSHRDLPSLQLVQVASVKALDWLKSYYWEPQKHAIPNQTDVTGDLRKRIRNKLQDLLISLKAKKTTRLETSTMKGKSAKRLERLCGPNKFLPFMSVKHTKTLGFKKQVTKSLNNVLRLYSSSSAEVVNALMECMLKSLELSGVAELLCQQDQEEVDMPNVLNEWKQVITKLANKKPELLSNLVKAILDKIEAQENCIDERLTAENMDNGPNIRLLCFLFEWAVKILCSRKPAQVNNNADEPEDDSCKENFFPEGAVLGLVRRCLAVSYRNSRLMTCALVLGRMLENKTLDHKLEKLVSLTKLDQEDSGEDDGLSVENGYENLITLEKDLLDQAARTEDLIQLFRSKGKHLGSRDVYVGINSKWVVSKSWNPCPIGMLPDPVGSSSGRLPVLDCKIAGLESLTLVNSKSDEESNWFSGKIDAACDIEPVGDLLHVDNASEMEICQLLDDEEQENVAWGCGENEDLKGHLMIDGFWKKVTEEEVLAIASNIRILVDQFSKVA